jgi:hypothetical protein
MNVAQRYIVSNRQAKPTNTKFAVSPGDVRASSYWYSLPVVDSNLQGWLLAFAKLDLFRATFLRSGSRLNRRRCKG